MEKSHTLQEGDCIHGLSRYECAVCYHPEGTCSYGHCQDKATHKLAVAHEIRPLCHTHVTCLQGQLFFYTVSNSQIWKEQSS